MPVVKIQNDNRELVDAYATSGCSTIGAQHVVGIPGSTTTLDALSTVRREAAQHEAAMLGFKKVASDASLARLFKDEAKAAQRQQKAATIWLDYFAGSPVRVMHFPVGLVTELDFALGVAQMAETA